MTEQVTLWPMLTIVTLAGCKDDFDRLTSFRHGRATLNSVCMTLPLSMYVMLIARPSPVTS
ncbi:Uncharacterised protein [Mycobacterium tuberculosis]|nr:Uncharacterised protein [Mycobacterium tuberculosis]